MTNPIPDEAVELAALHVVAVVAANSGEMLVLNRPLSFKYERQGQDFIGSDGPFRDLLYYQRGGGHFKAFAGRELTLRMADGTTEKVKDHWWHGILKDSVSVAYGDVESLRSCYVFSGGACMSREDYTNLRATYDGPVYPYWDYEKVIKYDSLRKELWGKIFHLEGRVKTLIAEVKKKDAALPALREAVAGEFKAENARLREALHKVVNYSSTKASEFDADFAKQCAEHTECPECQQARLASWPPSGLCNNHYGPFYRLIARRDSAIEADDKWGRVDIALAALTEQENRNG